MLIFAVGSWPHFGSLVVSLAMLGFGLTSAVMCIGKAFFDRHWRGVVTLRSAPRRTALGAQRRHGWDRHPCKSGIADSATLAGAVADGRPFHPWALRPVPQRGTPSAVPSNPNSRLGRQASPIAPGGDKMDATFGVIDVSKDRLGVHVRP